MMKKPTMYVMIASHDGGHRPVVPVLATSMAHPTTTTETARRFDFCIDCDTIKTKTKIKSLCLLYRIDQYVSYYHLAQADEIDTKRRSILQSHQLDLKSNHQID